MSDDLKTCPACGQVFNGPIRSMAAYRHRYHPTEFHAPAVDKHGIKKILIEDILDRIPGAWERAEQGAREARDRLGVTLDEF